MKCPKCGFNNSEKKLICPNKGCGYIFKQFMFNIPRDHRRFGWLKNEKKWQEDIASRRKAPDGSIVRVKPGQTLS